MTPGQSYVADNAAARERLRALVARLSDADLARPVGGGWSVALALAHSLNEHIYQIERALEARP
jgi:hypothetical protein